MTTYKVYGIKKLGCLFSEGISREFGSNKLIKTEDGDVFLASVQPLKVDPKDFGMQVVGTIEVEE